MGRWLFSLSIAINAALMTFMAAAIYATGWVEAGEAQEGVGVFWFFTLPGTLVVSLLCAIAYRRYLGAETTGTRLSLYVGLVLAASVLGPFVGWHALLAILRTIP